MNSMVISRVIVLELSTKDHWLDWVNLQRIVCEDWLSTRNGTAHGQF